MNAPNRSVEVARWVSNNRGLFTGDADTRTRELLTPLCIFLNGIEGRNAWGLLVKSDRRPPFVPHDIVMWRDTREHFDVFTGPDSGRAEDVQPVWGHNDAPDNAAWIWQSVQDGEEQPAPGPTQPPATDQELRARVGVLEATVGNQATLIRECFDKIRALAIDGLAGRVSQLEEDVAKLELAPVAENPPFELPKLVAVGKVPFLGTIKLPVVKA